MKGPGNRVAYTSGRKKMLDGMIGRNMIKE
jgi:hypothetical protein